jgi:hypothetical protein
VITLADFFPDGIIRFVPPPFDEKFWSHYGIPARVRVDLWGGNMARGLSSTARGTEHSEPGQRRSFGGSRKARGYASGTDGKKGTS